MPIVDKQLTDKEKVEAALESEHVIQLFEEILSEKKKPDSEELVKGKS
jgi:hypothetical protein